MAYTAWSVVFGEQPSAAKWNILGSNDASFNDGTGVAALSFATTTLTNPYKFRVYRNSAWTGSASYAKVQFDSEDFDSNSNFDSTTNYRYTAPVTGFYLFSARASNAQTGTSDTAIALYVNGSLHTTGALYAHTINYDYSAEVTGLISLTASDYVEVYFKGGSTGRTGNKDTYFCGYLVSQT